MIEDFFKSRKEYFDGSLMKKLVNDMLIGIENEFKRVATRYMKYDKRIQGIPLKEDDYDAYLSMKGYIPYIYSLECYDLELYTSLVSIVSSATNTVKEKIKQLDIAEDIYANWENCFPNTMEGIFDLIREICSESDIKLFSIGISKSVHHDIYPVHDVIHLGWDLDSLEKRFTVVQTLVDMM